MTTNQSDRAARRRTRRAEGLAAKWRADTVRLGNPLEPTDANLAAVLGHDGVVIPAKPYEYPAIREEIARQSRDDR